MKRKIAIALCACAMLAGCSHAVSITDDTVESVEQQEENDAANNIVSTEASSDQEQEGVSDTSDEDANTDETSKEDTKASEEVNEQDIGGEQVDRMNFNAYDKAAYLADRVYKESRKNTLVSPVSLNFALGMAAQGADGDTARELAKYLGQEDFGNFAEKYMEFADSLAQDRVKTTPIEDGRKTNEDGLFISEISADGDYSFHYEIANSLWVDKQYRLQDAFRDVVQQKFDAEVENVDFVNAKEKTADQINSWCEEKTKGLIPRIVEPDMFEKGLATVLVNSLYFESPWSEKWGLQTHEFTNLDGKTTEQEMLFDGSLHTYYENDKAIAFSKSYYNGFQFIGILPKETGEFEIRDLDLKSLMDSETTEYKVHALAPKLNFDCYSDTVVDILKEQGIKKAFDPNGGFEYMVEEKPLYIDKILQKCKIELDENGTKAAAVTAMMMKVGSAMRTEPEEIKEVYLDRPFAFMIYDSQNDQIVFVGKVTSVE